jgi:hypothetical protein
MDDSDLKQSEINHFEYGKNARCFLYSVSHNCIEEKLAPQGNIKPFRTKRKCVSLNS